MAWANGNPARAELHTVKTPTHPAARTALRIRCSHRMFIVGTLPQFEHIDNARNSCKSPHHVQKESFRCRDSGIGSELTLTLWQQILDRVSFLLQFGDCLVNLAAAEIVHLEARDNSPIMSIAAERQTGHQT